MMAFVFKMSTFFVMLCICVGSNFGMGLVNRNIPDSEMNTLKDLYFSTDGDNWRWRPVTEGLRWNFTGHHNPCLEKWQGLQCVDVNDQPFIYSMILNFYYLTGTIPATIGNLSHIEELHLDANNLSGSLPITVSKLSLLRILYFDV